MSKYFEKCQNVLKNVKIKIPSFIMIYHKKYMLSLSISPTHKNCVCFESTNVHVYEKETFLFPPKWILM